MGSEWQDVTIGDLCNAGAAVVQTGPFGSQLLADEYLPQGVPVVPNEAIRNRQIDWSVLPRISKEKAKTLSRHLLQVGDILFARRGIQATGHIGYIRQAEQGMICGTGAILLRVKKPCELDSEFLSHVLADPRSIEWFKFHAVGATMPNLNDGIIRSFRFLLPQIEEQRRIAAMLSAMDDRIELCRELCGTLEELARAIFKSWFVDFDPVQAKAEGREPEGMDADTAVLFPTKLKDSDLGEIPSDWNIECFDKAVDVTSGGTPKTSKSEYWGGDIPWFSIVDAPAPSDVFVIETEKLITNAGLASCSARLLPVGATIISARGTVGKLAVTGVPMAINQSCYALLPKVFGTYGTFFQTGRLVDILRQFAHGAVFSTITRGTLSSIKVVVPPKAIANSFEETVGPLMDAILNCRKMSKTLTDLRDTLLPRLISGKLRVPEAEKLVEAVL